MSDLIVEEILKEDFERFTLHLGIPPELMLLLIEFGFERCPEDWECDSRDGFGDSCSCIRGLFGNKETFELYIKLREDYLLRTIIEGAINER